ncbi:hypothetical protein Hanom_Chr10g00959951 [Helianthus anomalus]
MMFHTFYAAKSLTVSACTIHLLALFPSSPPLWDLKCLKLDFSPRHMYIQSKHSANLSAHIELLDIAGLVKESS